MSENRVTSENRDPWASLVNLSSGKVRGQAKTLKLGEAKALQTKGSNDQLVVMTQSSVLWGYVLAGKGGQSSVYFAGQYPFNGEASLDKVMKLSKQSFEPQFRCLDGLSPNSQKSPFIDQIEGRFRMGNMNMMVVQKMDRDLAHVNWTKYKKPGSQFVSWLEDCLHGLASLHRKDFVHRDIKGANFLVKDKGGAKITDFGLAGKLRSKEHRTSITPGFGAPFIWKSLEAQLRRTGLQDKEADIWSVGRMIQNVVNRLLKQHGFSSERLQSRFHKFAFDNEKGMEEIREAYRKYGARGATTPMKGHYRMVIHPDRDGALNTSVTAIKSLTEIDLSEREMLCKLVRLAKDLQAPTRKELYQVLDVDPSKGSERDLLVQKVLARLDQIRPEQLENVLLQENRSPNPERTGQVVRKRDFGDDRDGDSVSPTVIVSGSQSSTVIVSGSQSPVAKKRLKFVR